MEINGYKVVISRPMPRMQLSDKVPVTDEFRAEINAWMIGFFGMRSLIPRGQVIVSETTRTMYVNEADYDQLRREIAA